jgi:peptidyl-prolyl cis-trans isomerase A (cyclophilin A)
MKQYCLLALIALAPFSSFAEGKPVPTKPKVSLEQLKLGNATDQKTEAKTETKTQTKKDKKAMNNIAVMKTSLGTIKIKLWKDLAPNTVANFVGLATGEKEWTDPKSGEKMVHKPLYNGTIFHRVIPNFMIQGGDPLGKGIGGPGYRFADEIHEKNKFDKPGYLAMANSGPGTNGSQFFITTVATPHLNKGHTLFGEVTEGMDVVMKISEAPRDGMDKPKTDIKIETITFE